MSTDIPTSLSKPPTAKGLQRMEELIRVASEMFLEHGFEAVALDELIARAGGSRRNVYSYFGGKEGLFIAAMTQVCEEIATPLERIGIEESDPYPALISFGCDLLEAILSPRTVAVHRLMVAEGRRFPELAQAMFNAGPLKVRDCLASWLEARKADADSGICSDVPAELLAEQFIDLVLGYSQLRVLVGLDVLPLPTREIEWRSEHAVRTFLRGVQGAN